jgi:hypothetical protein
MAKKRIRFVRRVWEPKLGDSDSLSIEYEIEPVALSTGEPSSGDTDSGYITIDVSRTLQSIWGLDQPNLENFLTGFAKQYASSKVEGSSQLGNERIQLTSYNAPEVPPVDPRTLMFTFPTEFQVTIPEPDLEEVSGLIDLASNIIDARDNINAVFGEKYGDRLLSITQERALLELSRPCNTREEFAFRISSLAGLAVAINTSALDQRIQAPPDSGSIDKLRLFLRSEFSGADTAAVAETISKLNQVRRMYPVHTDRAPGVIAALGHFGIEYPVDDFQAAMTRMMEEYLECLINLLAVLKGKQ